VGAVSDAAQWAAEKCRRGDGPTFLEVKTHRLKGHHNRDIEHYRSNDDIQLAQMNDPIATLRSKLIKAGTLSEETAEELMASVSQRVTNTCEPVCALPNATSTGSEFEYTRHRPLAH